MLDFGIIINKYRGKGLILCPYYRLRYYDLAQDEDTPEMNFKYEGDLMRNLLNVNRIVSFKIDEKNPNKAIIIRKFSDYKINDDVLTGNGSWTPCPNPGLNFLRQEIDICDGDYKSKLNSHTEALVGWAYYMIKKEPNNESMMKRCIDFQSIYSESQRVLDSYMENWEEIVNSVQVKKSQSTRFDRDGDHFICNEINYSIKEKDPYLESLLPKDVDDEKWCYSCDVESYYDRRDLEEENKLKKHINSVYNKEEHFRSIISKKVEIAENELYAYNERILMEKQRQEKTESGLLNALEIYYPIYGVYNLLIDQKPRMSAKVLVRKFNHTFNGSNVEIFHSTKREKPNNYYSRLKANREGFLINEESYNDPESDVMDALMYGDPELYGF